VTKKTELNYLSAVVFMRESGVSKKFYTETLGMKADLDFGTEDLAAAQERASKGGGEFLRYDRARSSPTIPAVKALYSDA
jgi:hypothetical protein